MIIDEGMVLKAIALAERTAVAILARKGMTWGPQWVDGIVRVPEMEDFAFSIGTKTSWNPEWGEGPDFFGFAQAKLETACRTGYGTGTIVALCPWQLQTGENLYPGGVYRMGIGCGISGAVGRADEAIASVVVDMIIMLAHLETDRRQKADEMVI